MGPSVKSHFMQTFSSAKAMTVKHIANELNSNLSLSWTCSLKCTKGQVSSAFRILKVCMDP